MTCSVGKLFGVEKIFIMCLEQYWTSCQTWLCLTEKSMFGIQNITTSKNREVRRGLWEGDLIPLSVQTSLKFSSCSASFFLQWWANPRRCSGTQRLLAKDVQVTECCKWYQQSVWAGHIRMHHCSLWNHYRQALPLPFPTNLPSKETQTPHR